jgi:hypothetical protein
MGLLLALAAFGGPALAADYATPEEAVAALETALKADDLNALHNIYGPNSDALLGSGDKIADHNARDRFLAEFEAAHRLQAEGDDRQVLIVGENDWPSPIPLVRADGRWHFDTEAGAQAIADRRIGENEIAAIGSLLAVVDAEHAYFELRHEYARRFLSNTGRQDGLYWQAEDDAAPSPLAALAATAEAEGYSLDPLQKTPALFRGYYYRFLTGQGPSALGGAKSWLQGGKLVDGFGLLAWPSRYGNSGLVSFQVGPDGVVFQKDLGPDTAALVGKITRYDPDLSWARVDVKD